MLYSALDDDFQNAVYVLQRENEIWKIIIFVWFKGYFCYK